MRRKHICLAIAAVLLAASLSITAQDARADDAPLYVIYGHIRSSDGQTVPDGTLVTAKNLDRTDDNTMYFYTITDGVSGGRYTVVLHLPGEPTSYNSMSFSDGDRIKVTCSLNGETGSSTHVVDVSSGSTTKQMDFMLKPAATAEPDEAWYENPMTLGIIVVILIAVGAAAWYLFVPSKGGR